MLRTPGRRGFTLIEFLVVLAIVLVLAGILFPVFSAARAAARQSACASNFRQIGAATLLYADDYDQRMPPASYIGGAVADPRRDKRWPQLVQPYVRSFSVFRCPSDPNNGGLGSGLFDPDLTPSDPNARFYAASERVNVGYNYLYLAPLVNTSPSSWISLPRSIFEAEHTSATTAFIDSAWRIEGGRPTGGGTFLVAPPCRFAIQGQTTVDTFLDKGVVGPIRFFEVYSGWGTNPAAPYGGAWPWHRGRATAIYLDGSVRALTIGRLTQGCDAQPGWRGFILDGSRYTWDLR